MGKITVGNLLEQCRLGLHLVSVEENGGLNKAITVSDLNRPGLALAGYFDQFSSERVQLLGKTELSYISGQPAEHMRKIYAKMCAQAIPAFIICRSLATPPDLHEICAEKHVPIITSSMKTSDVGAIVSDYLREELAPETIFHGDLVDVDGIGVLILGKSGIGKSECALDLVSRGHRLVADDIVHVKRKLGNLLVGRAAEKLRNHIEIQGIGILNVSLLYGIHATRLQKRIELIVRIEALDKKRDYERTGLSEEFMNILGVEIPFILIPAIPGKNISHIIEVAALNHLLKLGGFNSAKEFNRHLIESMTEAAEVPPTVKMDIE
jgi:HPr kinase/phosphorylase